MQTKEVATWWRVPYGHSVRPDQIEMVRVVRSTDAYVWLSVGKGKTRKTLRKSSWYTYVPERIQALRIAKDRTRMHVSRLRKSLRESQEILGALREAITMES